jgi:hypothetical protein
MRHAALATMFGVLCGCAISKDDRTDVRTAELEEPGDAGTPILAERLEDFACDLSAPPDEDMEPVPFDGSTIDWLLIQEDAPCEISVIHHRQDGTMPDTVLFTGNFSFTEIGILDVSSGTLVACASQIALSPPVSGDETEQVHEIENASIWCSSNAGSGWVAPTKIAGPSGNEWAAWSHSVEPAGVPGEFDVTWIRDFTLFPFNLVDEGRPADDGVYVTRITVGAGGMFVGPTTKLSDSVLSINTAPGFEFPDGTEVPFGATHEFEFDLELE